MPRRLYSSAKIAKKPRKPAYKPKPKTINLAVAKAVKSALAKNIETKQSNHTNTDYQQIGHNNFITLDQLVLGTTQGITDPATTQGNNRIGDQISLKGVSFKMMLELNERYSDVSYRILVVKTAKGDVPTKALLYNGLSGNKMLDTLNRERYTIVFEKWGKMKSPNIASNGTASGGTLTQAGTFDMLNGQQTLLSRATKIVKFYIPYNKFQKSPILQYQDGTSQLKFFDYYVLIYAYSNFSTSEALGFNVLAVNDYIKTMYFKDA